MSVQYWVGDFFIDLTRNQITQKMQSQTIPPKALAVLTYLAKNANQVVSHDELLSEVWPDTVVTPNTLQRSIAQLRKALGEDSQLQSYIKTHPKQGYSLEVEVRWQEDDEASIGDEALLITESTDNPQAESLLTKQTATKQIEPSRNLSSMSLVGIFLLVALIGFIGFQSLKPKPSLKLSFGELRSLTATDNKELGGIYSPDGEYIVFQRYSETMCMNSNIWAKNTRTQEEIQLTQNMGAYGSHSFSKDGTKLIFIESERCDKPITQKQCYKLMSLNFQRALESPQSPSILLECKNSKIAKPVWLDDNNVILLQEFSRHWKLVNYSLTDNKSKVIYSLEDGSLLDYDYSVSDELIALTSARNNGQYYIEMIKPDGQLLSSHPVIYPEEISSLRYIYPNFSPISELLIFSTGRQLFTLTYEGKVTNISLPLDEPMGTPIFHPDGKRMIMTKGNWDSDLATISLSKITTPQSTSASVEQTLITENSNESSSNQSVPVTSVLNPMILERSTVADDDGIYQPNGQSVAFRSRRTGEDQVWITDGVRAQQLSHFPMDTYMKGMSWAIDGKSLLANVNNVLTQVDLDSNHKAFPLEYRVENLFQWQSEENTALLIARINGRKKLVEVNLNNSEYEIITDKEVKWARKSEGGRILFIDHMDRFWQSGSVEFEVIEVLEGQVREEQFIVKENVVYGVNEELQLWSYDLIHEKIEVLGSIHERIDYITDIKQDGLLISVRISAKKELAELILRD